ncbi:hypothetical protein Ahy_B03g063488 [Arachis hypogaea]|uniref:Uncharacterized protein n=1 Tax=Arachis hypogaea TaxID=3818 RepID=A0A444ZXU3_ARAHY|nr:hypothetical protein Ahy_B03g063488 [Arachis hypogaea]
MQLEKMPKRADCPILLPSGSGAPTSSSLRPFRLPPSEPLPTPQACTNDVQNSEPDAEDLNPEADEVDFFDQHVDNLFVASDAQKRKGRKTTEFWDAKTIESDGTIKQVKLSVKEAMKPPNERKTVLRFNSALQPVGDEAGLLSGIIGLLGSDYTKFPICEKDWRKVRTRDKVYSECVKEMFHFEEDSRGIIKCIIFKMLGRAWKETKNRLYHHCYDPELSLEENIENRPDGITEKCKKNAENRSKQLYTHTGESKSLARLGEEESERQGRRVSRGELYLLTHKRANGSYVHDAARAIGGAWHREKTKRQAVEVEVAAEKTKRQAMEDEAAAGKVRMQAMESVLICLLQRQGGKLPSDVAAWMSALEGQNRK